MSSRTVEGVVENGKVRLPPEVQLPENAKVIVILPGLHPHFIGGPRLVHREDAPLFQMEVITETPK